MTETFRGVITLQRHLPMTPNSEFCHTGTSRHPEVDLWPWTKTAIFQIVLLDSGLRRNDGVVTVVVALIYPQDFDRFRVLAIVKSNYNADWSCYRFKWLSPVRREWKSGERGKILKKGQHQRSGVALEGNWNSVHEQQERAVSQLLHGVPKSMPVVTLNPVSRNSILMGFTLSMKSLSTI